MNPPIKSKKNAWSRIGFSILVFLFSVLSILILINSTGKSINSDSISANLLTGGDTKTGGDTTTASGGKTTPETTTPTDIVTTPTTDTKTQTNIIDTAIQVVQDFFNGDTNSTKTTPPPENTPDITITSTTEDSPPTTNSTTPTNSNTPTENPTTPNNNSSTPSSPQITTTNNTPPTPTGNNSINNTNSPVQSSNSKDLPNEVTNEIENPATKINFLEELNKINYLIKEFTDKIYTTEIVTFSEAIVLTGITLGAISILTGTIAFNVRGLSHLLGRLWSILIYGFGIKKRARPWGTVYDSSTKQPIDPAYVILRNMEGETINTCMTDIDGRYGFLVEPGKYVINVYKTHFVFPSLKLARKNTDEFYDDLYFGEQVEVQNSGQVLAKNIPMDRKNFD